MVKRNCSRFSLHRKDEVYVYISTLELPFLLMQIGFYAGYVASAFTFGRFVSGYPLGQVTDAVGRKPVIISGLLSIMVFSLTFGLSPTFGFAITTRFVDCLKMSSAGFTATRGQVLAAFHILLRCGSEKSFCQLRYDVWSPNVCQHFNWRRTK